jgi:hypothetical protein
VIRPRCLAEGAGGFLLRHGKGAGGSAGAGVKPSVEVAAAESEVTLGKPDMWDLQTPAISADAAGVKLQKVGGFGHG